MDKLDQFPDPVSVGERLEGKGCTTVGGYYSVVCEAIPRADLRPDDIVMTSRGEFFRFNKIISREADSKFGHYYFNNTYPTGVGYHWYIAPEKLDPVLWRVVSVEDRPRPADYFREKSEYTINRRAGTCS